MQKIKSDVIPATATDNEIEKDIIEDKKKEIVKKIADIVSRQLNFYRRYIRSFRRWYIYS